MLNKPTKKDVWIGLILVTALLATIYLIAEAVLSEAKIKTTSLTPQNTKTESQFGIIAKLTSVDLNKGEAEIKLMFVPGDDFTDPNGLLNTDIELNTSDSGANNKLLFKKGSLIKNAILRIDLSEGTLTEYPFDKHKGILSFAAFDLSKASSDKQFPIPLAMEFQGGLHAHRVGIQVTQKPTDGLVIAELIIQRSNTTIFFAIMIMVLQWMLAIATILVVWTWFIKKNKLEVNMFGWMGALLFALIPIRNAMPGVPPIGVLCDYLSLFWVMAIISINLFLSVVLWVFYRARP